MSALILAFVIGIVNSQLTGGTEWNQLRTTWGINPFTAFYNVELTESKAKSNKWTQLMSCSEPEGMFIGNVYYKGDDLSSMPIYNAKGQISGLILGVDNPGETAIAQGPWVQYTMPNGTAFWGTTAYFRDPSLICSDDYKSSAAVGDRLWFVNDQAKGTEAWPYLKAPLSENSSALSADGWVRGACFWQMGVHYWIDSRADKPCDELFPIFLLYNNGVLNAWGIAMAHSDRPTPDSKKWEHPQGNVLNMFFSKGGMPSCLPNQGKLSTQHVFMNNPAYNICPIW